MRVDVGCLGGALIWPGCLGKLNDFDFDHVAKGLRTRRTNLESNLSFCTDVYVFKSPEVGNTVSVTDVCGACVLPKGRRSNHSNKVVGVKEVLRSSVCLELQGKAPACIHLPRISAGDRYEGWGILNRNRLPCIWIVGVIWWRNAWTMARAARRREHLDSLSKTLADVFDSSLVLVFDVAFLAFMIQPTKFFVTRKRFDDQSAKVVAYWRIS